MSEPKCTCNLPRHNEKDHDPGCAIFEPVHLLTKPGVTVETKLDFSTRSDHELDRRCAELMGWPIYGPTLSVPNEGPFVYELPDSRFLLYRVSTAYQGEPWSPSTNTDQAIQVAENISDEWSVCKWPGEYYAESIPEGTIYSAVASSPSRALVIATLKAAESVKETKE